MSGPAGGAQPPPGEAAAAHPTSGLDDIVHQRHRLGILTITAEARAEFSYLRDALGLTPGNLSRHLSVLEEAGLIKLDKGYQGRRPRTWVRITHQGRTALAAELATLTELVRRHAPRELPANSRAGAGGLSPAPARAILRSCLSESASPAPAARQAG